MRIEKVKRSETLPEQIAGILRGAILREEWSVGQRLPSEAALAKQFETNRVSLRQAIQVLKQEGLIEGSQGKAWRVADFRDLADLGVLPDWFAAKGFCPEMVQVIEDFVALRAPVLQQVVERAMERMDDPKATALRTALLALEAAVREGSREAIFLADLAWFEVLLEASGSLLYRFMYRPLSRVYRRFSSQAAVLWVPPDGYLEDLWAIQAAIERRDRQLAKRLLVDYLEKEAQRLLEVLRQFVQSAATTSADEQTNHNKR